MIVSLPEERWYELMPVFTAWGCTLPNRKGGAMILADVDAEGEILGFCVVEKIFKVNQIYSTGRSSPRRFFRWLIDHMSPETSVISIADDPKYYSLCEKFKMYELEGKVYRRDF